MGTMYNPETTLMLFSQFLVAVSPSGQEGLFGSVGYTAVGSAIRSVPN